MFSLPRSVQRLANLQLVRPSPRAMKLDMFAYDCKKRSRVERDLPRGATWAKLAHADVGHILAHLTDRQLASASRLNKATHRLAKPLIPAFLGLSESQWDVFRAVLERKESVLLMGSPGTGKSFLLGILRDRMPRVLVTASTGAAAEKISASTFHSALGLGIGDTSIKKIVAKKSTSRPALLKANSIIVDDATTN